MLKEFHQQLSIDCEDIYTDLIDGIISDLLKLFPYRAIPKGNTDCEDFVDYLGKAVYNGNGSLKVMPEINYEAGQFSRKAVADLTDEERFIINVYFAEFKGYLPTDEDIHVAIMSYLDSVLYDMGRKVMLGE